MKNIDTIINAHNRRISDRESQNSNQTPNCDKRECPLQGECLTSAIVYQAEVKTSEETKSYIGITGGTFKRRFNNHNKSFENEKKILKRNRTIKLHLHQNY